MITTKGPHDQPADRHATSQLEQQRGDRRYWAVREQVREIEQQIREEAMSEEERHWHCQWRQRQADIAREARRRLGLPEEEHDG